MRTFGSARGSIAVRRVALPMEAHVAVAAGAAVCAGGAGPSTDDILAQIEQHVLQLRANEKGHRRQLAEAVKAGEAAAEGHPAGGSSSSRAWLGADPDGGKRCRSGRTSSRGS